jgi:ERCC4-type nuclease
MDVSPGQIFVDFRENRSQVPKFLTELGVDFKVGDLRVDYQIGQDCFVERKTVDDFITSIGDGRLFHQVAELAKNFNNPLLLLEGGGLYQTGRVPPNLIRGMMLWITVRQKVPLLRTSGEYDTACILRLLARKVCYLGKPNPQQLKHPRKIISPWRQQMEVLTQIPGIGWQIAKSLLGYCGTVTKLPQLSDEEIANLPGMGKSRIKNLRQIFPFQEPSILTEHTTPQAKQ